MKINKFLLLPIILLFLSSCYIYKPYKEKTEEELAKANNTMPIAAKSFRNENSNETSVRRTKEQQGEQLPSEGKQDKGTKQGTLQSQNTPNKSGAGFSRSDGTTGAEPSEKIENTNNNAKPKETGIKAKLEPNKYYKISALGNLYKIQVDKWEGDTLVAHKIRKPEKIYKLHMNDIDNEAVLERVFSKPFSDLLTVGAYASGAAIVLLLVL